MSLRPRRDLLRVLLQFHRAQSAGDPYGFRFEPQDYTVPTEGGASPSARFEWSKQVLDDLQAVRLPGRDPVVVQRMGERLRSFVMQAGWAEHEREIEQAIAEQRPVHVSIRSAAAELYALPWELLTLKSGQFIGEVDGLLVRFEWPESDSAEERPCPRQEGGRILVAWSAAGGAVPASEHIRAISAACTSGFQRFDPETDVITHASLPRIVRVLEEAERAGSPIAVLHLLCHGAAAGSTFGLALDGAGGPVVMDATQLRQQLAPFASAVRLVSLLACDSGNQGVLGNQLGSVALTLHRSGFQSVLASRSPLSVAGTVTLTQSFYHELLSSPSSVETAFLVARASLAQREAGLPAEQRPLDWASMQLYARQADGDDTRPVVFRPFRGLLAFQQEHRRFFFGRDDEVAEILRKLGSLVERTEPRLLVVAGGSGTGKSSLVFAGAVPRLLAADPRLAFLKIRPGSAPLTALGEALSTRRDDSPALLVVDQFEEIFTQTTEPAARAAFVRRLWALACAPEPGLRVLLTVRVDFIGRCGELVVDETGLRLDRVAYDEPHRVFVAQLEAEQLHAAITEPAHRVGLELQAGLPERMIREVGGEPGALPLLEDALDVLWQHRSGRVMTQEAYDLLGGVVGALQKRADAIFERLEERDRSIAQHLLLNLVAVADDTALDSRLRVPVAELRQSMAAPELRGFEFVLKELAEARLLVLDQGKQAPTAEVAHEALIRKWPRLRAWLDEDRAGLVIGRRVRQAAQQWALKRDESLLYHGTQLAQASEWRKARESRLGQLEREFLDASEARRVALAAQERERVERERVSARRTRAALAVVAVLFVAATVSGGSAVRNASRARQSASKASESAEEAKKKSAEAHAHLLAAVAQTIQEDPTSVAAVLREARYYDYSLWTQSATDALESGISESILTKHHGPIFSVAFSRDGTKVLTGGADGDARVWTADGATVLAVLKGNKDTGVMATFSPDGKRVLTSAGDGYVRIFRLDGSGEPAVFERYVGGGVLAFSPDEQRVLVVDKDGQARIVAIDGSSASRVLKGHKGRITSAAFCPTDGKVATGSRDGTVRIWSDGGSDVPIVLKEPRSVEAMAFSPDGKRLLTGNYDSQARIWNTDGKGAPILLKGHSDSITTVAFGPDNHVVTGSADKTALLWTLIESKTTIEYKVFKDEADRFWSSGPSPYVRAFQGHAEGISAVAFSPDGKKIMTGSRDGDARIWPAVGTSLAVVREAPSRVSSVAYSPDGKAIAAGGEDGAVYVFGEDGTGAPRVLTKHEGPVRAVAYCHDGKKLVSGGADGIALIWNADGSGEPTRLPVGVAVDAVACSPDGQTVVTSGGGKTALVWKVDRPGAAIELSGHEGWVQAVAFSADGKRIVTGSEDHMVRIFASDGTGAPLRLTGHKESVDSVAFSPDGTKILSGGYDTKVLLWSADGTGEPLELKGHSGNITAVAFSPDGNKAATSSGDETIRIWNVDGHGLPLKLRAKGSAVGSLAYSPDGQKLVMASMNKIVLWTVGADSLRERLWNATRGCLPERLRRQYLLEPPAVAREGNRRCQEEVARRFGAPSQPVR